MLNPQLSAHFVAYSRLLQEEPARLLQFLADEQQYVCLDKYDYTDRIGAPTWHGVGSREGERDALIAKLRKNPGKALMLAHSDPSQFTVTITELLDGPRLRPRGSGWERGSYAKSSISVRVGEATNQEHIESVLEFLVALFETVGADHGHAHDITDAIALDGSAAPLSFLPGMLASAPRVHPGEEVAWPLQSVYWANFFSERWKALIDGIVEKAKIGGLRRRDLRNGGLLLLTAESPQDPEEPGNRKRLWALWKAAGLGSPPNRFLLWKLRRQHQT